MKLTYIIGAVIGLGLTMASCSDDPYMAIEKVNGELELSSMKLEVAQDPLVIESRSGENDSIDVSGYRVEIVSTSTGETVGEWAYSELPDKLSLAEGSYTISVASHLPEAAAWEKPYYAGSKSFSIKGKETTQLGTVTCSFAAIKVTVEIAPDLKRRLEGDAMTTIKCGISEMRFGESETRAAYFVPEQGVSSLIATFTATIKGQPIEFNKVFGDVASGQHRKITLYARNGSDVIPEETGRVDAEVVIDARMEEEHFDSNVNAQEQVIDPSDQGGEITFSSATIDFTKPNSVTGSSYIIDIKASEGIAHLIVKIETDSENFFAAVSDLLPTEFDLAYPNGRDEDFKSLNLPIGSEVLGQKEIAVDLSEFVPLLSAYPGTHHFIVTVADQNGRQEKRDIIFVS